MNKQTETESYVENLQMAGEIHQHVAHATIRIGEIQIRGVKIWRAKNGRLFTHWPSFKLGFGWEDVIELPAELRTDIEADVISAYKDERKRAAKEEKERKKS